MGSRERSIALFISNVLSSLYVWYLYDYFYLTAANSDLGGALAAALVTPHLFMFFIGVIFGWLGFFCKKGWGALVAAILYTIGTAIFLVYAMFGIPLLIFGFIGFARQKARE